MVLETPREAVEFARMVVRAFYPEEFVILLDAVLRMNNYCAHGKLAKRLGMPPKELRQMLTRMVQARLMKSDKRQQKKVNIQDERRAMRTVTTEFWYVPLGNVVDAFIYRVHKIKSENDRKRANEREQHKWRCSRCGTQYQILDILGWNHDGTFICERIGVRADRRPAPCGGEILEENNSSVLKETERVKQMLDEELRALQERAIVCANMDIPNHPLAGADKETWDQIVPEIVGMHGEKVDEDGVPIADKEEVAQRKEAGKESIQPTSNPIHDDAIPEKPSWFKDAQQEEADDDWDPEQENTMGMEKGSASAINTDEEKAYMEQYLREIGGLPPENKDKTPTAASAPRAAVPSSTLAPTALTNSAPSNDNDTPADTNDGDEIVVYVAGKPFKLSEVTEEMQERMTEEEFLKFSEHRSATGGDDFDDDDDFE